jgi:hypothetical protein
VAKGATASTPHLAPFRSRAIAHRMCAPAPARRPFSDVLFGTSPKCEDPDKNIGVAVDWAGVLERGFEAKIG